MAKVKKSQSTVEYAMLIAIVVAAVVGMDLYMRRSVQANLKMTERRINEIDWKSGFKPDDDVPPPKCKKLGDSCDSTDECCRGECIGGICKILK